MAGTGFGRGGGGSGDFFGRNFAADYFRRFRRDVSACRPVGLTRIWSMPPPTASGLYASVVQRRCDPAQRGHSLYVQVLQHRIAEAIPAVRPAISAFCAELRVWVFGGYPREAWEMVFGASAESESPGDLSRGSCAFPAVHLQSASAATREAPGNARPPRTREASPHLPRPAGRPAASCW